MANPHFYLKKAEKSTGKALISLQWKYNGYVLRCSTRQTIDPSNWNIKKERVKEKLATTEDGKQFLNELLSNLESICIKTYNANIPNGIPHPSVIKEALINHLNGTDREKGDTFHTLFQKFVDDEIPHRGKRKSRHTTKSYQTTLNHLKKFERIDNCSLTFETINDAFAKKYLNYLEGQSKAPNTVAKHFKCIRAVMNRAVKKGYTANVTFRNEEFTKSYQEVDAVYLNEKEVEQLFAFDLSKNKKLEAVKDLFVFGCLTGFRFSDFSKVKIGDIRIIEGEKYICKQTQKTTQMVIVPCDEIVLQIFEKYSGNENSLPKSYSNAKFNEYIKDVCKKAGFTQYGRLESEPEKPLYKCISSHTCRRSFATNKYLSGIPCRDIMAITGHKTEKSFLSYLRLTNFDAAKRIKQHMKQRANENNLKVAS